MVRAAGAAFPSEQGHDPSETSTINPWKLIPIAQPHSMSRSQVLFGEPSLRVKRDPENDCLLRGTSRLSSG